MFKVSNIKHWKAKFHLIRNRSEHSKLDLSPLTDEISILFYFEPRHKSLEIRLTTLQFCLNTSPYRISVAIKNCLDFVFLQFTLPARLAPPSVQLFQRWIILAPAFYRHFNEKDSFTIFNCSYLVTNRRRKGLSLSARVECRDKTIKRPL